MTNNDNGLPLAGIKVVEFTHMVMGPAVGAVLVELGAEVVRVEPVGGDSTRELRGSGAGYFPMYNRNKKSICLDLKNPEGLAVAKQLCQRADVVIENFRTGTMDKLGLGYAALSADNPRLIVVRVSGWGQSGPYSELPGFGSLVEGFSGYAHKHRDADGRPVLRHPAITVTYWRPPAVYVIGCAWMPACAQLSSASPPGPSAGLSISGLTAS